MAEVTPHVFVTQGDITHLACDAWLLPTDARLSILPHWLEGDEGLKEAVTQLAKKDRARLHADQAVPVHVRRHGPIPVLTPVPLRGIRSPKDYQPAITSFVASAVEALAERDTAKRPLRLLAMPAFGMGRGGAARIPGETLQALLAVAEREARERRVDIVIVLREPAIDFIQSRRRDNPQQWWPSLSPIQRERAARLGAKAAAGQLVPFLGAGVSASAGAPTWRELTATLARQVHLKASDYGERALSPLDQAEVVREAFKDDAAFRKAIVRAVALRRYGLLPAMVASLGSRQAITLNYDTLLEQACTDIGKPVTVLPWDEARRDSRWVLKLHGTVERPESIVLTRDDYLGYSADRSALSAIVKALLFTHELLFLGFSLTDDHFHSIAYDVRKALPPGPHTFGTAVVPRPSRWLEAVWSNRVEIISVEDANADFDASTRLVEIFMDCLLCHASTSQSYLLRDGYEQVLSPEEKALRQRILGLVSRVQPGEANTPAWNVIQEALTSLGYQDDTRGATRRVTRATSTKAGPGAEQSRAQAATSGGTGPAEEEPGRR